jgi:hypothetical protein
VARISGTSSEFWVKTAKAVTQAIKTQTELYRKVGKSMKNQYGKKQTKN